MRQLTGAGARLRDGVRAALPAWFIAHGFLLLVCWQIDNTNPLQPLYSWDTHWYLSEAVGMAHGGSVFQDPTGPGGLAHFFPLTPLAVAGLTIVTRLPTAFVLFAFCWGMALVFGALVHMIAVRETGDRLAAERAVWLSQLAPGAFALVMGYTEPLAGALAALYFLAVRRKRPGWGFVIGLLAGVSRPTGIVLALPGFIEAVRTARHAGWSVRSVTSGLAQSAAPAFGLFAYLAYCQLRFHDWILPFSEQVTPDNRGAVMQNPISTIQVLAANQWYPILWSSLLCAAIAIVAIPVCWARLPGSYTAWSIVMFVLGITSPWFTSEPRYLAAIFPLLIALPLLLRNRWVWYTFVAANLALLYWVSWLALSWGQVA